MEDEAQMIPWRSFVIAAAFGLAVVCPARDETPATQAAPVSVDTCRLAADYSARFKGISMLVMLDGEIIFEDYPNKSGTRTSDTIALHFASASKCQRCVSPIDSRHYIALQRRAHMPQHTPSQRTSYVGL